MKYDGIGFNGPHLAKFSKADFMKEVDHFFSGEKAKEKKEELYQLIQAKYNPKKAAPQTDTEKPKENLES
jgi:hypothetical protein